MKNSADDFLQPGFPFCARCATLFFTETTEISLCFSPWLSPCSLCNSFLHREPQRFLCAFHRARLCVLCAILFFTENTEISQRTTEISLCFSPWLSPCSLCNSFLHGEHRDFTENHRDFSALFSVPLSVFSVQFFSSRRTTDILCEIINNFLITQTGGFQTATP